MSSSRGILYAVGAYGLWGLLPVYWKVMQQVPAHEIIGHRMVWSLPFVLALLIARRDFRHFLDAIQQWRVLATFLVTAALLTVNWYTYIFAINSDHIVDASLGYFINPLLTVMLGVFFLRERPRLWQWVSFALALGGVLYLTFVYGTFPWIGLLLAFTFGFYGLIRKTAALDSVEGLALENAFMFLPALIFLLLLESNGSGTFGHAGSEINVALALTGAATATPLILFAAAVRRARLTTMGLLHYIAPSLQFLIGILVYGEPVSRSRLIGFSLIWVALALFSVESLLYLRGKAPVTDIPPAQV